MKQTAMPRTTSSLFSLAVMCVAAVAVISLVLFENPLIANAWSWAPPPIQPLGFTPSALTGYAWSDNIGWISLSCSTDPGGCSTPAGSWGISINPSNGVLSGYAWSDNVGWISANSSDLVGCPLSAQGCTATLSGNTLVGSLRALSADNNGWDGWIRLSNNNVVDGYMVFYSGGGFEPCTIGDSCAWGSDVVGWVDFSDAHLACTPSSTLTCTGTNGETITRTAIGADCSVTVINAPTACGPVSFCSPGSAVCLYPPVAGTITVLPKLVNKGATAQVTWGGTTGVSSCQVYDDADSVVWTGLTNGATAKTTGPINKETTYTLSCVKDDPTDPTPYSVTATVGIVPTYHEH